MPARDTTGYNLAPPERAKAVVPSDGTSLDAIPRALYVGTAGNLAITMAGGDDVTLLNVEAGSMLPLRVTHVKATGTTAANIVAFW